MATIRNLLATIAEGREVAPLPPFEKGGAEGGFPRWRKVLPILLAVALAWTSAAAGAEEVELGFLNGTYTDLASGLEPIEEGPLTIHLSSPEHRLVVHGNRLSVRQAGPPQAEGGLLVAAIAVELEGEGRLIADVRGAGVERRFTDEVTALRQTVTASGEIRLERIDEGFVFTVERPGPAATFEIKSGVAGHIVGVCRAIALLPLFDLGCDRLERALSILRVPLPEPGTRLLLRADSLTPEERSFFDRLIGHGQG